MNCDDLAAVVVGGGAVATRKAISLHDAGASVRVIAPEVSRDLLDLSQGSDRVLLIQREYSGADDIRDADVVIAATNASAVNSQVASDARELHRLVSVVSHPGDGSFSSMAVHRAGQLTIGVSAGNVPGAAARIRDEIAARFDERYSLAISRCAGLRSDTLAAKGSHEWSRLSARLLGPDFCRRVEDGLFEEAIP